MRNFGILSYFRRNLMSFFHFGLMWSLKRTKKAHFHPSFHSVSKRIKWNFHIWQKILIISLNKHKLNRESIKRFIRDRLQGKKHKTIIINMIKVLLSFWKSYPHTSFKKAKARHILLLKYISVKWGKFWLY